MLLDVRLLRKAFPGPHSETVVLEERHSGDLSFSLDPGRIVCLFGPSGCGKSTFLRMIAGVDLDYGGEILLNGVPVLAPTREIGMVMQGDASFEWLTVAENITFALRYQKQSAVSWLGRLMGRCDPTKAREEAVRLAELVDLPIDSLDRFPRQISGGMKQRMLFARALLPSPAILLLDEPFSSLDYESRQNLQDVLLNVRDKVDLSYVCVSHDPDETLFIADEVLLLGGSPASIVGRQPGFGGDRTKLFTVEFQEARRELHEWLRCHK